MFCVRQHNRFWFIGTAISAVLLLQGCSNSSLARFAPPGIVKYEDIAGEKPPNPTIQETVRAYQEETNARFPVLSQTPSAGPMPKKPPQSERDAAMQYLIEERDVSVGAVDNDRTAVETDIKAREALTAEGEAFAKQLEEDRAAASAERRQDMADVP